MGNFKKTPRTPALHLLPPRCLQFNVLLNCIRQGWLRNSSNHCVFLFSFLENHNSRDTSNAILSCNCWAFICVDLQAPNLACIFLGKQINLRGNHAAWSTPWGPEINQHRDLTLQHKRLPCFFSDNTSYCKPKKKKPEKWVSQFMTMVPTLHSLCQRTQMQRVILISQVHD